MQLLEPTMLETVSCPIRAASTVPKVTVIKTGKETKVLCFFHTAFYFFFRPPFKITDEKNKYWKIILCIS